MLAAAQASATRHSVQSATELQTMRRSETREEAAPTAAFTGTMARDTAQGRNRRSVLMRG